MPAPDKNIHPDCPPEVLTGIDQFNRQEFFECHETLEDYWRTLEGPHRELIQGIIQIAVAYYHLLRNNPTGAGKLFERGLGRLAPYRPTALGLDLDTLATAAEASLVLSKQPDFSVGNCPTIPQIRFHCQ